MVTRPRWVAECDLMANVFPEFAPYSANGVIGFRGKLQGPQTGLQPPEKGCLCHMPGPRAPPERIDSPSGVPYIGPRRAGADHLRLSPRRSKERYDRVDPGSN